MEESNQSTKAAKVNREGSNSSERGWGRGRRRRGVTRMAEARQLAALVEMAIRAQRS
jgi:hypothetical protein